MPLGEVSFVPQTLELALYAGDGARLRVTVKDRNDAPVELTGEVIAQIRKTRTDPEALQTFAVEVEGNVVTLKLTAAQTVELGKFSGVWDCQWTPEGEEPQTLISGKVTCVLDVTRA